MISLLKYLQGSWESARGYLRTDLEMLERRINQPVDLSDPAQTINKLSITNVNLGGSGIGTQGPVGAPGQDGQDGDDGLPGAIGPQGLQGFSGLTIAGQDGEDGQDGLSALTGDPQHPRFTGTTTNGSNSQYVIEGDTTLGVNAGSNSGSANGVVRAILKGANLLSTAVIQSALHAVFWITGTDASVWPKAALVAEVHDSTTAADAAVVALLGGDSGGVTTATAGFATRALNSTPGNQFTYGVDLGSSIAGYTPASSLFANADERHSNGAWRLWLTTPITANVTTTSAPAGSWATTTHATGLGTLFYSDGSKWQKNV